MPTFDVRALAVGLTLAGAAGLVACSDSGESGAPPAAESATVSASASATESEALTPAGEAVEAGLAKHVDGDLDGATADYTTALESDPQNVLALYNLGLIAQTQGNAEEA